MDKLIIYICTTKKESAGNTVEAHLLKIMRK